MVKCALNSLHSRAVRDCVKCMAASGAQGDDVDEVAHQPAWLQDDAPDDRAAADGTEAAAGVGNLSLHERAASNGAADFIGLDNGAPAASAAAAAPYANGNGHSPPAPAAAVSAAPASAAAAGPAAPAPARDPLEDLLSLSAGQAPEPPEPGGTSCVSVPEIQIQATALINACMPSYHSLAILYVNGDSPTTSPRYAIL